MQIGLRTLGGDPERFYALDLDRQIDVLASLQLESEAQPPKGRGKKGGGSIEDRVTFASDEARAHWGSVFRS